MIVTEAEAKTKRCQEAYPAAHGLSQGGYIEAVDASVTRHGVGYARQTAPAHCIGSECMAWSWVGVPQEGANRVGTCGKARSR